MAATLQQSPLEFSSMNASADPAAGGGSTGSSKPSKCTNVANLTGRAHRTAPQPGAQQNAAITQHVAPQPNSFADLWTKIASAAMNECIPGASGSRDSVDLRYSRRETGK